MRKSLQPVKRPPCRGNQSIIVAGRCYQLHANRQTIRPFMRGQCNAWHVEQGPAALERQIPRPGKPPRRFARGARRQQYVMVLEDLRNLCAAFAGGSLRFEVILVWQFQAGPEWLLDLQEFDHEVL